MVARMTRTLELTDERQHAIIPLIEQFNASRRELNRKRRLTLMRPRPMIEDDPVDQASNASPLKDLDAMETPMHANEEAAIGEAPTPLQQAKFMLFQERFRPEMQDRLRGLGDRPGPGRRPGQPLPPPPGRRR